MAYLINSGAGSVDLGVPGTIRDDFSDYMLASLMLSPTTLAIMPVGPEFVGNICRWDEDRLNADFITDTTPGGQTLVSTSMTVSPSDFAILDLGMELADISATTGGAALGEHVTVSGMTAPNTITIVRSYSATPASTHAQNAVWSIIAKPIQENSDIGRDTSRARIPKYNYMHRHEMNVNLSSEVIVRSRYGYSPGINDELEYQFYQRFDETVRIWNKSLLMARPSPGTNGVAAQSGGNYSTMAGLVPWLDGSFNPGATVVDFAALGFAAGAVDKAINYANKLAFRNGVTPDWCLGGANAAEDIGFLYSDRIRIQQDESTRGFAANLFRSSLTNELRMVLDGNVQDTSPAGIMMVLDTARMRFRPAAEQWLFLISAPTLRDGDAVRALSKGSFEMRNTGIDTGQAHFLIKNVTF
jgi:hypothetical protein